jgi:hypothetical protein
MIKTTRRLLVPLIACAIAACGSDQTGPGPDTLAGTYQAVSVNGSPLPFTTTSGSILKSYTITLRSDQTYDLAFAETLPNGSPSNVNDSGTYVYSASSGQLSFTGQQIPGTLHAAVTDAGATLTLSSADVGYTIVLKR